MQRNRGEGRRPRPLVVPPQIGMRKTGAVVSPYLECDADDRDSRCCTAPLDQGRTI